MTSMAASVTKHVMMTRKDDHPSIPRGISAFSSPTLRGLSPATGVIMAQGHVSLVSAWQGREADPRGCGTNNVGAGMRTDV